MPCNCWQAEAEVDSMMEQVSQADSKIRSPFKRRAGLTDEEMGMLFLLNT